MATTTTKIAIAASSSNTTSTSAAPASGASGNQSVQEFKIRVPKKQRKRHHVMRFNATLNVDFNAWKGVKMERENNLKEFRSMEEDMPKFGAGSEYNRDFREEVRRKKFGIVARKYKPESQPWILKVGGKSGKKFKGIREGGVSENAAFYVFTHAPDGHIEAYPLNEWYNFQPIQRYKALSAEEAEQEFGRRKKVMNYFSLMLRKRLKGDEEEENDPEEVRVKGAGKKSKELKISEMDEWIDSADESDSDSDAGDAKKKESDDDGAGGSKNKKGKKPGQDKKKKRNTDQEAVEESDDGDEEGREMDYDTESSEDEPDPEGKVDKDLKGVAEEDALRKLLTSDEEDEEEKNSDDSDSEGDEKKNKKDKQKDEAGGSKDKKKKKSKESKEDKDTSSDFSSDSSDSEEEMHLKKKKDVKLASTQNSRSSTPTSVTNDNAKRKMTNMPGDLSMSENSNSPGNTPAKRTKADLAPTLSSTFAGVVNNNKDDFGITEDAVRRYLMRKPMTTTELLTKFKSKRTGVSSDRLVETMTQILKKINPVKQTIQGKMYLSIKTTK